MSLAARSLTYRYPDAPFPAVDGEIGRASCRERV